MHDRSAGEKRVRAYSLIERLARSQEGVISVQVLQELYVSLIRRPRQLLGPVQARTIVQDLLGWTVVAPGPRDVLEAIDASVRWQISFWDAMLITTARTAGASILWTEDLSHGQNFDGVEVRNPFW